MEEARARARDDLIVDFVGVGGLVEGDARFPRHRVLPRKLAGALGRKAEDSEEGSITDLASLCIPYHCRPPSSEHVLGFCFHVALCSKCMDLLTMPPVW